MRALVVLSGGQDSTTCLFWAKQFWSKVHAITFDYGQRHRIEIESAIKVAELANVESHEIVQIPNVLKSTSPLTSNTRLEQYDSFAQMNDTIGDRVELTFVPMRNPFFLTVAVNRAVALNCFDIITGICQEDNANYPDCTENFRHNFQHMVNLALRPPSPIRIVAPLMHCSKADTVRMAHTMPACWEALAYSHTSYDGKYPPTDKNHANVLRAQGFLDAGLPDPLVLRAVEEGLMKLPETSNYRF